MRSKVVPLELVSNQNPQTSRSYRLLGGEKPHQISEPGKDGSDLQLLAWPFEVDQKIYYWKAVLACQHIGPLDKIAAVIVE
ncbi:hypothetical protein INT43_001659 [Umbelopsis isabellina]|uniref:Uncharacterized protein n=1 Tax=Mortierella isabellina TaxID=91625 RepID=A0A8H7PS01_MORIS|nr:hypothetical protein INT43_001659 [Umbelopsis isabellina]